MGIACASCLPGNEKSSNIFEDFFNSFNFKIAVTEEEKKSVYALRHEVFCQELNYAMASDPEKKMEWDAFDEVSTHCLIEHKRTGLVAGCLRLVTLDQGAPFPLDRLPIEAYCEQSLIRPHFRPSTFPRDSICEASRLAISQHFRKGIKYHPISSSQAIGFTNEEVRVFPVIIIGLFLSAYALAELASRDHMFAMMEPGLPRILRKSGFNFLNIGGPINFHGIRNPFYINSKLASSGINPQLLPLYRDILQQLSQRAG